MVHTVDLMPICAGKVVAGGVSHLRAGSATLHLKYSPVHELVTVGPSELAFLSKLPWTSITLYNWALSTWPQRGGGLINDLASNCTECGRPCFVGS